MNSSVFDPSTFIDFTTTEASTRRAPLPAARDYPATVTGISVRQSQGRKDPNATYTFLDIKMSVSVPPDLLESVGQPTVGMQDSILLDTTPSGGLDMSPGRNGRLRRYREALGLNTAGQPFSPRMMEGRQLQVKVKHETYEGEIQDRVDSVAKMI